MANELGGRGRPGLGELEERENGRTQTAGGFNGKRRGAEGAGIG